MSRRHRHKSHSLSPDIADKKGALPYAAAFFVFVLLGVFLIVRGLIK